MTIDPTQIQDPKQIPPPGSQFAGETPGKLVDVYYGTIPGDVDAQPAAKELLGTAADTGSLSNADYIYRQVAALYGGADLPDFQSPSGNKVKSVVFVSGSTQGSYGAFHLDTGSQVDFDRIVLDSLTAAGSYSPGSVLGAAMAPLAVKPPRVFAMHRGPSGLLGVLHPGDERLKNANPAAIELALTMAGQSSLALKTVIETGNPGAVPRIPSRPVHESAGHKHAQLARRLVQANQDLLGLVRAAANLAAARAYLSTALFAAEIVESFQMKTAKGNPGRTDGEAVSRVVALKLAPEIALIPGFNGAVTQQWWKDGHVDCVNDNARTDQDMDGNGGGVTLLLFLTDYLGVPVDRILQYMPATNGAPLGQTYAALLKDFPDLAKTGGADGGAAFQKMVSLLQQNAQNPDGSLNLPADGNPWPSMPGGKQGGLFAGKPSTTSTLSQDLQVALGLEAQLEQQLASLKAGLQQIQGDVSGSPAPPMVRWRARWETAKAGKKIDAFGYNPPLPASVVASLNQRANPFRAPQYDQSLQDELWKHVYNELPGTGPNTDRLQVITGTIHAPLAVQITGTIRTTKPEPDGDLHIWFQPDDPNFPRNQGAGEAPLEIEIIYVFPVTQQDAKQAEKGYKNPFDVSQLGPGTRMQAAGPLIFDRAHGKPAADGKNVDIGLEIHPLVGMTVLGGARGGPPVAPGGGQPTSPSAAGQLTADVRAAAGQADTLSQSLGSLNSLLQKMKGETPSG